MGNKKKTKSGLKYRKKTDTQKYLRFNLTEENEKKKKRDYISKNFNLIDSYTLNYKTRATKFLDLAYSTYS